MASLDGTITWRELQSETVRRLQDSAVVSAESEARHLIAEASGADGAQLALVLSERATERAVARLDTMVGRRVAGEPLQYVLGHWPFRRLDLLVDHRVLIPRPETEVVVEVALAELDRLGGSVRESVVVDLGTGSGAIGLAIATERVRTKVWATDRSDQALEVATANLAGTGRASARVRLCAGSWFEALPPELMGRVDLVVSNPPYVASSAALPVEVGHWEPSSALLSGVDGTDDLRSIIAGSPPWLVPEGVLVCELSPEQASSMATVADEHFSSVRITPDLAGRDRVLVAAGPRR